MDLLFGITVVLVLVYLYSLHKVYSLRHKDVLQNRDLHMSILTLLGSLAVLLIYNTSVLVYKHSM
jgi:hypothetical protein